MRITLNNPLSRRQSPGRYKSIIRGREEAKAQQLAKDQAAKEEQERLDSARKEEDMQKNINTLCDDVQNTYTGMVNAGKELARYQDELNEKRVEEDNFYETLNEVYDYKGVDDSKVQTMKTRRLAYYLLPVLDSCFAFLALYPIMTSKLSDLEFVGPGFLVGLGALVSLAVGFGLSVLARLGMASLDETKDKDDPKRWLKYLAVGLSVLALPLMYVVGEIAFNGGEDWTYSGSFALVSLLIQLLIITGYKRQQEARQFLKDKEYNDQADAVRTADENALKNESKAIQEKIDGSIAKFDGLYTVFTNKFRALAAARDEFLAKIRREPSLMLNQMVIYFGNLVCFRREVIPFHLNANGAIELLPVADFPHVSGCREMFNNHDFTILNNMLQRTNSRVSLAETLRQLEGNNNGALPGPAPGGLPTATPADPAPGPSIDFPYPAPGYPIPPVAPIPPSGGNAGPVGDEEDDSEDDGGVIW